MMQFIGYLLAETNRALLFQDHFWESSTWMPKSQIDVFRDSSTFEVRIKASDWISRQKCLREGRTMLREEFEAVNNTEEVVSWAKKK